jgi:threonine/homoserine/homoserine lactone efflux protein
MSAMTLVRHHVDEVWNAGHLVALETSRTKAVTGSDAGSPRRTWEPSAIGAVALLLLACVIVGAHGLAPGVAAMGLWLGFSIAAPIGPMGALCIRRTLLLGQPAGLVTGLGAATIQALYAGLAALGQAGLADVLATHRVGLLVLSGAALAGLGTRSLLAPPALGALAEQRPALWVVYASTVALALPNPLALVPYAALGVTWAAAGRNGPSLDMTSLMVGVFVGAMLWWALLSTGVAHLRARLLPHGLPWINRVSGVLMVGLGSRVLLLALGA